MPYIHFTEEQKLRASEVDLVEFLRCQGETLIRSGPEFRLASDHSVTVRGSEWYDHAAKQGGNPISFVQQFYNLSYPEAMLRLLGGEQGTVYAAVSKQREEPKKEFFLPPANRDMRRVFAYFLKRRMLDREVVNTFARAGLIYESCEKTKEQTREYHNAVFVGRDENGVPRHAHKRSVNSEGKPFRINVEGCDPRFSFHHTGTSDRLYVFEAPIDLLSFLSLYPRGWQAYSFVALCGTSEHAMLWMLEQNSNLQHIVLCLDHDAAGIEANGRLTEVLHERDYDRVGILQPEYKDWNEDLKARHGLPAQEAEEHPQLIAAVPVCRRIGVLMGNARPDVLGRELNSAIRGYRINVQADRMDAAMDCMEQASALALFAYGREQRQRGEAMTDAELVEQLQSEILPHQNRGSIKNRHGEIAAQMQDVLIQNRAPGIRSAEDKERLAQAWLDLAVTLAKIPIKYDADMMKKQQKQMPIAEQKMEAM